MPEHVKIFEVGPRDGLQNQKRLIATEDKIKLVDMLSNCGFSHIETTSFVSPKWVPQMADAAAVMAGISKKGGTAYTALTPNMRGYEAAIEAGVDEVAIFGSASEGFSWKNINCSIEDSLLRFLPIIEQAKIDKCKVRGYVSCVTHCPYDGRIAPDQVIRVALRLLDMGCYEISLGDTIGAATPETTHRLISSVMNEIPGNLIAGHFHDTNNNALKNIDVCLEAGIRTFDSAVGGLGGCPYAEGAKGNVDTVAVVNMLHEMNYETGLSIEKLNKASAFARSLSES
ncbi:hydroxymethylglutaryl-CoA lyase [Rhodobacterales bacterium 52_120_T64]|nr:hydroxymethylglutaryl-CoA lyase [Rhodobacterales bacterium 52_120_T64]